MKIGIIYVAYNTNDLVESSLRPWIDARLESLGGHKYVICAVSVPFAGFPNEEEDGTTNTLRFRKHEGYIDHVIDEPRNVPETVARGMALNWLQQQDCDISWMVDGDEFYGEEEITRIAAFVGRNPFVAWFRLSLKNYVFDAHHYLADPFQPPRIHRLRVGDYKAHSFSADNDIQYGGTITRDIHSQEYFPSMTIPPEYAWIRHESWPNSVRSKKKIKYQLQGRGWPQCSFSWDDSKGGLIFNPALPAPKVIREI